ncbi:DUF4129 domain-containing protein [Serinicoccus marinus]|uniref:DUF4129 domain-containing protein n=1 Tax=Serinicoccus marinus TaxID=247333 RepID=UPI0003B68991|nr:DUF4129 domain-containing protein [Serinicoccus marinus]
MPLPRQAGHPLPAAPIDPDRDEARRLLTEELESGDYRLQEPWLTRAWRWFVEQLPDVPDLGALPPWTTWAVLGLVLCAVAAVLVFASRDRWRAGRLAPQAAAGPVLGGARRSAADYRTSAREALSAERVDEAVLDGYRALAAGAIERTLLDDRPGRTAHEVAQELSPVFPVHADDLRRAGDVFDAVRYGDHRASTEQAQAVLALDERLLDSRPELAAAAPRSTVPS